MQRCEVRREAGGVGFFMRTIAPVRHVGRRGCRARVRSREASGGRSSVPNRTRSRELISPEAVGVVPGAPGAASTRSGPDTVGMGPAGPRLRLRRRPHNRPAGNSGPLAPAGVSPLPALVASPGGPPRRTKDLLRLITATGQNNPT